MEHMTTEKNLRPRTLFFDVDGTLVDHGLPVSPAVRDAIRRARRNGHLTFLCTGRSEADVQDYVRAIGFDGEVTNAGAYAKVGDESILERKMTEDQAARLIDYMTALGVGVMVQTNDQTYADQKTVDLTVLHDEAYRAERLAKSKARGEIDQDATEEDTGVPTFAEWAQTFPRLDKVDPTEVVKVIFVSDRVEDMEKIQSEIGDEFQVVPGSIPFTGGSSAEICVAGVNKGFGIIKVLEHLGLDIEDAIGIGDSWNDLEMFQMCGLGVVMANADPELKKHADMETASVQEDGVARALEALGLV